MHVFGYVKWSALPQVLLRSQMCKSVPIGAQARHRQLLYNPIKKITSIRRKCGHRYQQEESAESDCRQPPNIGPMRMMQMCHVLSSARAMIEHRFEKIRAAKRPTTVTFTYPGPAKRKTSSAMKTIADG
eukprot:scaffold324437_cov17-Prasinocladus_malaysianus.AAC.1